MQGIKYNIEGDQRLVIVTTNAVWLFIDRDKTGITVVTLCPHHWPVRGLSRFFSFYHQPAFVLFL